MYPLRAFIAHNPRTAAALAFGISTATLTHFAWYPDARLRGMIPVLTFGAGFAHAVAGAITGRRLIDRSRMRTSSQAALLGAGTSLLALAFFAPAMAVYVSQSNARPVGALGYAELTLLTGSFAFLAAGWALLLLSAGVGWGLHRMVEPGQKRPTV
jgi:hypothetical protein